uniref:Uncharacterized protein n=1 Tax=Arundo donax TaxID=35708 RepID=A0A0A9BNC2_ARUDO
MVLSIVGGDTVFIQSSLQTNLLLIYIVSFRDQY